MTPNELYNRVPENSHYDLDCLIGFYYSHIPEIDDAFYDISDANHKEQRILIKEYKYFDFDGRRIWRLASVWFDDNDLANMGHKPVMIIQNAGREGDDHDGRFITDEKLYMEMITHIRSLVKEDRPYETRDVVDPDVDINNLTSFYGNDLDGHFERYKH